MKATEHNRALVGILWALLLSIPVWILVGLTVLAVSAGCRTAEQTQHMDELSDAEFAAYKERVAGQICMLARAAIQEEDLSAESCRKLGEALKGLALGTVTPAGGTLMNSLDVEGYGAAVMGLALIELDASLAQSGGLSGGWLSPRGEEVVGYIGDCLITLASMEQEEH